MSGPGRWTWSKREAWPPICCGCCGGQGFDPVDSDRSSYRASACADCGHRVYQLIDRRASILRRG